ncbi:MAG TPA: hypothetical protein VE133_18125, partial [Candidatus Sulfotelmatobacter sp.]|nr:hypothetical protein [Candidatus Sulfotelmatobacter sp.]
AQLATSAALVAEIAQRWQVPLDTNHVIRHHQIRFSKSCPGNFIQIQEILDRASAVNNPGTPAPKSVRAVRNLNLRTGSPSLSAPIAFTVAAQTTISVSAAVHGSPVNGNNNWYADGFGHFFWAGGTDQPNP